MLRNVMFACVLDNVELNDDYTVRVMYREGHEKSFTEPHRDWDLFFEVINKRDDTISYVDNDIDWFDHNDKNVLAAAKLAHMHPRMSLLIFFDYLAEHLNIFNTKSHDYGFMVNHGTDRLTYEEKIRNIVQDWTGDEYDSFTQEELEANEHLPYGTDWHLYDEMQDSHLSNTHMNLLGGHKEIDELRLEYKRAFHKYRSGKYLTEIGWQSLRQPDGRLIEDQGAWKYVTSKDGQYRFNLGEAEGGES